MRRAAWAFAIVLLLPVLAAGLLLAGLNTAPGQRAAARAVAALTGGQVALTGLSGSFPDALHADSLVLRDGGGAWLRIDDLVLDWSPLRLLHGEARIDRLSAGLVALARLPRAGPAPAPASAAATPFRLPVAVNVAVLAVARLEHALLHAHGTLRPGGQSDLAVALPELAPFAALGGVDARGTAALDAKVTLAPFLTVDAGGTVALTGGQAPLPGLIGADGRFALRASRQGGDIAVSALTLDGARLHATAQGGMTGGVLGVDWTLGLPDLAVLAPSLDGALALRGRVAGAPGAMTVNATLTGDLAPAGRPRGPVTASIEASGLPDAPTGRIVAGGTLDGAPLDVLATAARDAAGVLHLDIARAGWKSAHAEGALTLAPGATLPQGRIALGMTALSDLQALLGRKLAGGLSAEAVLEPGAVRLQLDATKLDLAGSAAGTLGLTATLRDPLGARVTTATLAVDGFRAGGVAGRLRLEAEGPPSALGLRLNADVADLGGAALRAAAAGTLDAEAGRLTLSALTADWRDQHLALARRLRVDFASGVSLDGLELRLGAATLSAKGRVLPALDLTASLRDLPAGLARLAAPGLKLAGTVSADARLTGPPARPAGTIRLHGAGLRVTEGAGATLKPADLAATATLAGERATLDARLRVGSDSLSLAGSLPLGAGAMDLRARGQVDLAALNALVAAEGRQVQGRLALDAGITGTAAAPQVGGTLHLTGGVVQDIPLGLRVRDIAATVTASGQTIRLASLTGRAGDGSIGASGTLSLASPMTLSLALTAKDAQLLASELVHGTLDADLTVQGALPDGLAARGTVTLGRTEIRVPDSLPAGVAVLDVRRPGQAPPPPASPGPVVGLDVAIRAPGQILVRGRGLDAELQGNLRVLGSSADPRPQGRFTLRRGSYTLAGKTLSFTSGTLQFDGGLPVDPTLDFVASSTSGDITATLTVTGHASAPKIVLSSAPELPQDEVLAQLLFNKSTVNLGPVELAQIAAALAQMAGGTSFDPLEAVRAGLGLDRLSVSGGSGSGQSSGATVEAGRSLAPGVYLGAKQNATGTGTKGTVEIDLGRGVRLQAGVGSSGTSSATGAAGNMGTDVGVTWQFDY